MPLHERFFLPPKNNIINKVVSLYFEQISKRKNMLTLKQLRDNREETIARLAKKGVDAAPIIEKIEELEFELIEDTYGGLSFSGFNRFKVNRTIKI